MVSQVYYYLTFLAMIIILSFAVARLEKRVKELEKPFNDWDDAGATCEPK
jgi:hypothetical protein